jgi:polyisoprenoid-binding protein YceI
MKSTAAKLILGIASIVFSTALFAADTYTLDSKHTYVLWHINHFGFSNPSGKWMAEGTIVIDDAKPDNSKVNATIHTDTLATGLADLDEHLKSPLFFDVKQFPTATFVSNKVKMTGKSTATVTGMLTLHGITKPVTLNVTLNKEAINPISNKPSVGFSATAKLNRSDFGITTLLPGLSDEVVLDIQAEGYK